MNGREVAEKAQEIFPDLPIIFASGFTEDEKLIKNIINQKMSFLAKPYTIKVLATKIQENLKKTKN